MITLHHAAATHTGRVRPHNEDAYLALPQAGLWLLADGMGGHESGEVASRIVCESITAAIGAGQPLPEAVQQAHHAVRTAAANGEGAAGMGSTVVALKIHDAHCQIAWVGDSRAYLWQNNVLRQLTRDHSFVQHLLDSGAITAAEASVHPKRNVILQSMGSAHTTDVKVGVVDHDLQPGDCLLLCSDGLNGELSDDAIAAILRRASPATGALQPLINAALERGGNDNVTVILVAALTDAQSLQLRTTGSVDVTAVRRAVTAPAAADASAGADSDKSWLDSSKEKAGKLLSKPLAFFRDEENNK
ncbi:serine/threonine-protein phosphatase [Permianibacter sp. IMCC34836]|uniref:PP2C family protein-serine/threonine phosphatase n=1 Tax=Permianibacter fluminis TaxID=2738515 RepID=UPI001556E967|nr:protein phosphatase 2C domain-containing protein [Permianibacter fluminis]NQD35763.1 serine/threonine-protein phosphatase [Permianibacter fluminis]